jgi:Lrp/AsnC family leucine-responsive transcriptional regulator
VEVLDTIDIQILRELQADGRLSIVDLAQRVGLSPSPCLRRVRSLEERGIIMGYRAIVDPTKLELALQFLVSFRVAVDSREERRRMRVPLASFPEVITYFSVTGTVDAYIQVAVPSFQAFERFLEDKLWELPIKDAQSHFIIKVRKPTAPYDLGHIAPASPPAASAALPLRAKRRAGKRAAK